MKLGEIITKEGNIKINEDLESIYINYIKYR